MAVRDVRSIVIVGGGTAGWMCAAALSNALNPKLYRVTLVESDDIGTVGVGEATVPHLRYFNQMLGLDENEFMRRTNATYKLGIEFVNWGKIGDSYIHPFGIYGKTINDISFHHYWLKARRQGLNSVGSIGGYSVGVKAAENQCFGYPSGGSDDVCSKFSYAFHIDASLYAQYLREYSEQRSVCRIEGKIDQVIKRNDNDSIESVRLNDGAVVDGDLFVDCSGFRGLLIGEALGTEYMDWSHWLPCNSAVAVPCEKIEEPKPYTRATAHSFGWQWRIPLQHRTGNGQVYCDEYVDSDTIAAHLLSELDGKPLANPKFLKFQTGRRTKTWNKNCVSVGLSSGFLEPLESTSIYLIQMAITKLIEHFPKRGDDEVLSSEFNRDMALEYERVRDFLVLHYSATEREDSEFWRYVKNMEKPDSLMHKIELFKQRGHVEDYKRGMFLEPSWVAVYLGQNVIPNGFHPAIQTLGDEELSRILVDIKQEVNDSVLNMSSHKEFIESHCQENSPRTNDWPPAAMSLYEVFS